MINKFSNLNGAKYFYSGILKNYFVFIPAQKYVKYSSGITPIICGNLMEFKKNIENLTKSDRNFALTFVNHHVPLDINFNEHCSINNKIYILKK